MPAGQTEGTVSAFADVMVAANDSHENGTFFNYTRGRLFITNSTLRMLIRAAYGVQDSEILATWRILPRCQSPTAVIQAGCS